jgi:dGTPase
MSEGIYLRQIEKEDAEEIKVKCDEIEKPGLEEPIEEQPHTGREERNQYHRDYARILYSSAYRRLQGKMQFLNVKSDRFYRNRLTHSQEVLQIARTIAAALKRTLKDELGDKAPKIYGKDMYVIEAASLAHDIGNPPFGHYGEDVLNSLMKDKGGFEGNAQTLRILNKLERKFPKTNGLCLSKRTVLSVLKYYRKESDSKKFVYNEDYEFVKDNIVNPFSLDVKSIDCQILDLADEIAYAAHDLEDALRQGFFSIDELLYEFNEHEDYGDAYSSLMEMVTKARENAKACLENPKSDSEEYFHFFVKELTASIVDKLVKDVGYKECSCYYIVKTGSTNNKELGFINYESLAKGLKDLTFKCISKTQTVSKYEKQGEKIINDLFAMLTDKNFNKNLELMPPEFRRIADDDGRERAVCDYVSGMMDTFSIDLHEQYFGKNERLKLYKNH